jgi:hypothetical protein
MFRKPKIDRKAETGKFNLSSTAAVAATILSGGLRYRLRLVFEERLVASQQCLAEQGPLRLASFGGRKSLIGDVPVDEIVCLAQNEGLGFKGQSNPLSAGESAQISSSSCVEMQDVNYFAVLIASGDLRNVLIHSYRPIISPTCGTWVHDFLGKS